MDYQYIINTAYRLLNAIDSLSTQVEQMQGMFDDSDGAIERSLERGEKATDEGTKLIAALEQEKLKHISLAELLEGAEDLLGKNVDAWEDEEDSVKEEHWDLIKRNSEYFKRKYQREAQAIASAEIEVKHSEPAYDIRMAYMNPDGTPVIGPVSPEIEKTLAIVQVAVPRTTEPEPAPAPELRPFSIILAWNRNDPEEGTYAWSGLAESHAHAVELARREGAENSHDTHEKFGDGDDWESVWEDCAPDDHVLESVEGVNIWAALELLAALKKAEAFIRGFEDDEMQEGVNELLAEIRAAIKRGECGE